MRSAIKTTALLVASAATLGACDYTGDWLFAGFVEGIPGVYHIYAEDGGQYLTPIPRDSSADEIEAATMYLEIGPEPGAALGGVTFNFLGTGGPVCVFVDPETAAWNNSVAAEQDEVQRAWSYPDNPFDDGDLDVFVGLSAYYNGSPGVAMGDFRVTYSDSLGNEVPIELSECSNTNVFDDPGRFFSGRGMPELCNLSYTDPGISYTAALSTFSTPLDDDRLGYGLLLFDGTCDTLLETMSATEGDSATLECVILGESLLPEPNPTSYGPYYGYDPSRAWPTVAAFEAEFCRSITGNMRKFCRDEADAKEEAGLECDWQTPNSIDDRCFCGDPNDVPESGAL